MKLVTALLARDEAGPDRYLRRVLARCAEFSDDILVLDDGSTDDTFAVTKAAGAHAVKRTTRDAAWGAEAPARAELWHRAAERARKGWVLVCDADMLLVGDPRPYTASWDCNAWAWPLADLWDSETTFRVDGPWGAGPVTPRPWLFKPSAVPPGWSPAWPTRGIHCGHAPANFPACVGIASSLHWLHLGWMQPEHRRAKAAQYASVADQLSAFERAHAATILD